MTKASFCRADLLARVPGRWYAELPTDRPHEAGSDLLVTRHRRDLILWPAPLGVLRAADLSAVVGEEMAFEVATLHAAAVNRRCSRSASATLPASSSSGVRTV
jgi:hypothetical protein